MATEEPTKKTHKRKKWPFVVLAIIVGVVLIDQTFIGGTTLFYRTWLTCGQRPVMAVGTGFMNAGVAHYVDTPDINIFPGGQDYYCTPIEAERAGFSASDKKYEYPHLKAAGERIPRGNGSWEYPDGSIEWADGTRTEFK